MRVRFHSLAHAPSGAAFVLAVMVASGNPAHAQLPPGEGPALGANRITQADITSGNLTLKEIRRAGLVIFSTPFNKHDGHGDGLYDVFDPDHTSPGNRPYIQNNGTFMRMNGLDTQACLECHSVASNLEIPSRFGVGGTGGIAAVAMPGPKNVDIDDSDGNGFASYDGRLINPPFVFGAGGVELVAKEMTLELQALKLTAKNNPNTVVPLVAKGVVFGSILFDSQSQSFDTSQVVGVDDDLAVRPFGRKGDNATIRRFDVGAFQFHQGMQPVEVVGDGVDGDGDGVTNEILIGELSALHIFSVTLERPTVRFTNVQAGAQLFNSTGCSDCHTPFIDTDSRFLPLAFPEVDTNPMDNVFYTVDLGERPTQFELVQGGGIRVRLYSDLKRHDMGPGLAESTGGPLDSQFITPRLWGLADTGPYLHDGRALTITEAIEAHGGEGATAAADFGNLSPNQKRALLDFLRALRTPRGPAADILKGPGVTFP